MKSVYVFLGSLKWLYSADTLDRCWLNHERCLLSCSICEKLLEDALGEVGIGHDI
jgi:hypothetical protein